MSKPHQSLVSIVSKGASVPERRSLSAEAADTLRELILLEKLAPGTPVPERDLAEGLGISRTPLKDALRILETEGLIEYGPTRRPRIADPSLEAVTIALPFASVKGKIIHPIGKVYEFVNGLD